MPLEVYEPINGNKFDLKIVNAMEMKKEWEEFVSKHSHGNIFQSPHLAEVFERAKGIEPIALAAIHEDTGEICASLLAYVIRYTNILSSFASWSRIRGGPLYLDTEEGILAAKILLKYYDRVVKKKVLYTDIRNLWDINSAASALFRNVGYIYEDHLNFLVDLRKTKEELWNNLSKSRRRFIRKARERGVTVEEGKDRDLIASFYELLKHTYRNAKIPLADISLFNSAFDILAPKNLLKLFMARYKDEYIGGIMCLTYKGTITEWFVTGSRRHSKLYPSDIVTWYPIEWGSEKGFHTFDFLGAGKPNEEYGVRDFKKQFGGKLVNFGGYRKVYSPFKMTIAEKGFEIFRRLL